MYKYGFLLFFLLIQLFLGCDSSNGEAQDVAAAKDLPAASGTPEQEGRDYFTSFDGTRISYLDSGSGQPVMLLHGFINQAVSWTKTALYKELQAQGYRVIIPDLRGNGMSDKPQNEEAYADNAEVKDLQALLDHLDVENLMAVGYSRGSIVLAKWLTTEDRISRAVIGGMGLDFTDPAWDRRLAFAAAFGGEEPDEMTKDAVDYANSIGADLRSLHLQQKYQPVTTREEIREINIPVMVVAGKEDNDNGNPGRLEELFPKGKFNLIPGDHNTTYRKEVFGAVVMAFLKAG